MNLDRVIVAVAGLGLVILIATVLIFGDQIDASGAPERVTAERHAKAWRECAR